MNSLAKISSVILLFCAGSLHAQNLRVKTNAIIHQSAEDSLLREFSNTLYRTYYNPAYMQVTTPTITMLKIDIDWSGKVTGINFSESADSVFVKAWVNKKSNHDDKATLERYAKVKNYKNVALLMPVSYQPNYEVKQGTFSYNTLDKLMIFNRRQFSGNAVMFEMMKIIVLSKGNM